METMRSVAVTGPGHLEIRQTPRPIAKNEYVVVRNRSIPICTEFKDFDRGDPATELGHEAAGEVVEVAKGGRVNVGDRVVVMPGYWCGSCEFCLSGEYIHCESGLDPRIATGNTHGFGTYADYLVKADWLLVPIPEHMSYDHASMACCGLGPALNAMRATGVGETDTVLVAGLGPVGLGAVIVARYLGARVFGVARNEYRSDLALRLGAESVINPESGDAREQIRDLTSGGPGVVVDTTGAASYVRLLLDVVRRRGHVGIVGEGGEIGIALSDDLIRKGLHVHGAWHYSMADMAFMMRMVAEVGDQLDIMITHTFPLEQTADAWRLQQSGRCGKVILHP